MTLQQKILSAVLVLAALGVVGDRMLAGGATGPQAADAAGPPLPGAPSPAAPGAARGASPAPGHDHGLGHGSSVRLETPEELADRLAAAASTAEAAAAAGAPDPFLARGSLAPPDAPTPTATADGFDAADFLRRHAVQAIITDASGASALINGRAVRVGHTSEQMRLTEISERSVTWSGRGTRFRVGVGGGG